MNNLAILTTAFNHIDSIYFKDNWNRFSSFIAQSGYAKDTYICEIIQTDSEPIALLDDSNHFTITNNSQLWHKECAINYLLKKLPDKYQYILVIDNDIIFENINWHNQILDSLKTNIMVQAFDQVLYLEKNGTDTEKTDRSMTAHAQHMLFINNGNPGMAVAYSREYLDHMHGLFDECIVGGGDLLNIIPFFYHTHAVSPKIFDMLCHDSREPYFQYLLKAKNFLENKKMGVSFIPNSKIFHLFHGYLKHRQYHSRYQLINQSRLQDITYRDSNNFFIINDTNTHNKMKMFFNLRQSLDHIDKPVIITNSKYGIDSDNSLWLAPYDQIIFRNISKTSITIKQHHPLKNIRININGEPVKTETLQDSREIEFCIENPYILEIFSEDAPVIPSDSRQLGLLITDIKILNEETQDMETYPLSEVL